MRVIIAGGRDFKPEGRHSIWLDELAQDLISAGMPINHIVCGMAYGADMFGLRWARQRGLYVAEFPADWKTHGRSAGPIRNRQMAEYTATEPNGACVLFPGGRGTQNMFDVATEFGLTIYDWRERTP